MDNTSASLLDRITAFADEAHGEQTRKYTPDRYIVHPVRVMEICRNYSRDETVLAAALLHDVLEDTPVTSDEMLDFLNSLMSPAQARRTVKLVTELTDVYIKADYPALNRDKRKALEIERIVKTSADAQTIKYADILDNCRDIVKHDKGFAPRFLRECRAIMKRADKGDKELRAIVMKELTELY